MEPALWHDGGVFPHSNVTSVHNQIDDKNRPASRQLQLQRQVQIKEEKVWIVQNALWQGVSSRHSI